MPKSHSSSDSDDEKKHKKHKQHGSAVGPAPPGYDPNQHGAPHGQGQEEVWMQRPEGSSNCPPGLEYLCQIDQLLVKQKVELFEAFTGYETENKYVVVNSMGQQVYYAKEDTDFCMRNCCGPQRPFLIRVADNLGQEVIHINRPYKCMFYGQCFSCSSCCQDEVDVQAPPGNTVGYVKQLYDGCTVKYAIMDADRETILKIEGPSYFRCHCPGQDIPFRVMSKDMSTEVGKIAKQWAGFAKEFFTDADNFGITFPVDLDVNCKATILGAVFLIDFMFFEKAANNNRRH